MGGNLTGKEIGGTICTLSREGLGVEVGIYIGSILSGDPMGVPDRICGTALGRTFGKMITLTVKHDDRLIKFSDLKRGDQIVMCAWFFHPRCHAIVLELNKKKRAMRAIRNTHMKGVIEEWLDFVPPVYQVSYNENDRRSVGDTIERARSKLGENTYNLLTNNCKHFACWCVEW